MQETCKSVKAPYRETGKECCRAGFFVLFFWKGAHYPGTKNVLLRRCYIRQHSCHIALKHKSWLRQRTTHRVLHPICLSIKSFSDSSLH